MFVNITGKLSLSCLVKTQMSGQFSFVNQSLHSVLNANFVLVTDIKKTANVMCQLRMCRGVLLRH